MRAPLATGSRTSLDTGDGDEDDTNDMLGAMPCRQPTRPDEAPYSPLSAVTKVMVNNPGVALIDTYADQLQSDITSAVELFAGIDAGDLEVPEPQTEDPSGNPVPGSQGQLFFHYPVPVPADHVPFPCDGSAR